jgi:16S rRNA (adenine1518-N6/adenine1519-N6)-dimethyltransferase
VESSVIRLVRKEDLNLGCDERLFRNVVKTAFSQRRKMLRNTLKSLVSHEDLLTDVFFQQRPEQLSVEDFVDITRKIEKHT